MQKLTSTELRRLRDHVERVGLNQAARDFGMSPVTLARGLLGLDIHNGTATSLILGLASLPDLRA